MPICLSERAADLGDADLEIDLQRRRRAEPADHICDAWSPTIGLGPGAAASATSSGERPCRSAAPAVRSAWRWMSLPALPAAASRRPSRDSGDADVGAHRRPGRRLPVAIDRGLAAALPKSRSGRRADLDVGDRVVGDEHVATSRRQADQRAGVADRGSASGRGTSGAGLGAGAGRGRGGDRGRGRWPARRGRCRGEPGG